MTVATTLPPWLLTHPGVKELQALAWEQGKNSAGENPYKEEEAS